MDKPMFRAPEPEDNDLPDAATATPEPEDNELPPADYIGQASAMFHLSGGSPAQGGSGEMPTRQVPRLYQKRIRSAVPGQRRCPFRRAASAVFAEQRAGGTQAGGFCFTGAYSRAFSPGCQLDAGRTQRARGRQGRQKTVDPAGMPLGVIGRSGRDGPLCPDKRQPLCQNRRADRRALRHATVCCHQSASSVPERAVYSLSFVMGLVIGTS